MAYWENVTSLAINPLCQIRWIIVKTDIEGKKSRVLLGGISLPFMYYSSKQSGQYRTCKMGIVRAEMISSFLFCRGCWVENAVRAVYRRPDHLSSQPKGLAKLSIKSSPFTLFVRSIPPFMSLSLLSSPDSFSLSARMKGNNLTDHQTCNFNLV